MIYNLNIMSAILKICRGCCPWLWSSSSITQYHKRVGETEHQQFMKQVIQPPTHDNSLQMSQRSVLSNKQNTKQLRNNFSEKQTTNIDSNLETGIKNPKKIQSQDILSGQIPEPKKIYTDCINQDHPNYELLFPKLQLLTNIFQIDTVPEPKLAENQYNLKIMNKQSDDDKTNIFVYSFSFPTTYQFYQEMQNNFQLQKSFDANIDRYQCRQKIDQTTKIVYLAYKKILIVSPRDFVYIRYNFKKGKQNWSIATSVTDAETQQGKTRGTIILTATRAIQRGDSLDITVYSQVDMKMPVKASAAKVRGLTEIKKYLDKCYDYVQKEKNNII